MVTSLRAELIAQLGRTEILLPSLIAAGLSANDRAKARLSARAEKQNDGTACEPGNPIQDNASGPPTY